MAVAETPTVITTAIRELVRNQQETAVLRNYFKRLAPLILAYENHRRQLNFLLLAHAPLTLFILIFAVAGGHLHTVQTVLLVYVALLFSFVLAIIVFGVQTHRAWMPRAFALALFSLSLWSLISVIYAVYTQVRMRAWYDISLLLAQGIDIAITIGYFYTAEMLAGIGGEATAVSVELHHNGLILSPHAHLIGDAAAVNQDVMRPNVWARIMNGVNMMVRPYPRTARMDHVD